MYATYKKLPTDAWGIRIESTVGQDGRPFQPGQLVMVNKADGALKTERLGRIVSVGKKYTLAEIDRSAPIAKKADAVEWDSFLEFEGLEEEQNLTYLFLQWAVADKGATDLANDMVDDYRRMMRAKADAERPVRVPVREHGIYKTDEGYFKVAKSGSGFWYAQKWNGTKFDYELGKGAIKRISATDKVTLEQAKEFGLQFGVCCICSRLLTDPESVANGIGPICAERF